MKVAVAMFVLIISIGCMHNKGTQLVYANGGDSLSASEVARLETLADAGDGDAAYRLFLYLAFGANNMDAGVKRLRQAANANCVYAEHALGSLLVESKQADERREGEVWLVRAANSGSEEAKALLQRLRASRSP